MKKLIFATRPSALARWQTRWVIAALQRAHPDLVCEEKLITTQGDRILDKPLPEIGGKGLFTQELEAELRAGSADCAVHSLKDLPVQDPRGLTIGCIPARGEARDVLISRAGQCLAYLPEGSLVGTSSLRRSAQLLASRPYLRTASLRGNVDTRLRKALEGQYDAILLAGAALLRLELAGHVTEWLPLDIMLPAPGQGALAVQCRSSDRETLEVLGSLEDTPTRQAVTAERAFLSGLGAGCSLPVAAYAGPSAENAGTLHLTGLVISPDGRQTLRLNARGQHPEALGQRLALDAISQGALDILAAGRPV